MLSFLPKKPVFTPSQFDRISNILDNAGQGFFVMLVLTPIVEGGFDKVNTGLLILGIIDVVFCWTISIILSRRKDIEV